MKRTLVYFGCLMCMVGVIPAWSGETIDLAEGWRFAPDPDQSGAASGWQEPTFDDGAWALLNCGAQWEDQGFPGVDGAAWYRKRVMVSESMRGEPVWLVLGALNDAGIVYCNGQKVATLGNETTITMGWDALAAELTPAIRFGEENVIAIRVFDWKDDGGLTTKPCALTTDPAAMPMRALLPFVPGFDGRPCIAAVELVSIGITHEAPVHFTVAVNGNAILEQAATIQRDHEGRPLGVLEFTVTPNPGDLITISASITGDAAHPEQQTVLTHEYTWPVPPAWPGKYSGLRVLNNFVTQLLSVPTVRGDDEIVTFPNPREGWVFVRIHGSEAAVARLDDETDPLVWRKHPVTGGLEVMRYLSEGDHELTLDHAEGAQLDIRAVPEIAYCYWPSSDTVLAALPDRDRAFAEKYIFPNANVLITNNSATDEEFAAWKAEGRHWVCGASLPGLHDVSTPTAEAVYDVWVKNPSVTRPGYSGMIVDEFLFGPVDHYKAWTEAVERLYANPEFKGKTFTSWLVDIYRHEPGLAFMRRLAELGGGFAWERYVLEQPTEEIGMLRIYKEFGFLDPWLALMPDVKERLSYCLGSFTTPSVSLNIDPGIHFLPFMELQFHLVATDPMFFGSRGIFQWAEHYTDDDVLRYAQALFRHYCIEGNRTPFGDYPYRPNHIANPDFAKGLEGWHSEGDAGNIQSGSYRGLGNIEGRWTELGVGDTYAVMKRSETTPNRISQTIKDLVPGKLYSMKYIAGDLDNLDANVEVGLWSELEGVDLVAHNSFRTQIQSPSVAIGEFSADHRTYMTYVQVIFRPQKATANLTFTDWKDGKPDGPNGQRIAFNFVEIQPFYE